nr:ACP S-malonyltransferase [Xanthomonadales bacterium]NIX11782.1 ACP S-malonyltransferase [Xanthomonadales bacterium]
MGDTAFLFPGQGSQSVGMLAGLAEEYAGIRETFEEASSVLGYDLWRLCQEGPAEDLNRTETTQPAMLAAGVATWRVWLEQGGETPTWMAGHSLGEYSALVAAGAMDFRDAVATVAERGRLMQAATPEGTGAMAAVLGLEDGILESICAKAAEGEVVSCANFNAPGQVVIAGNTAAVQRACDLARAQGARRAIELPVSVPSHCDLMKPAAERLGGVLYELEFRPPMVPVVHNVDVGVHAGAEEVRDALSRQLWQPVRWTETIAHLIDNGVTRFVECGPGKVLAGLNRRIDRTPEVFALTDGAAVAKALGT